ncbi:MAG: HEAT repeat domain-containing protein, partial [Planctomycetota bacterium]|nr:HEAT repeat domain-containing protein [Planctomycetota bacterium]
ESQAGPKPAGPAPKPRNPWADHKLPDTIGPLAKRVGAPRELVDVAWKLRCGAYKDAQEAEAALARLKGAGKEGLLAFATLALGQGTGHTNLPGFIAKLDVPDADVILIELIESHEHPHGLVSALGTQDTAGSRDFLVDWLPKHAEDAGMYWTTATALGRLKEPRGAAYLDIEAITGPSWGGVRGQILWALGQMGGDEAAAKLGQYLGTPHADKLGSAASALALIDKDAARRHAKRLLASDRAKFIHWMDRSALEKLAKDE